MTPRRRLATGLGVAAALLLGGRTAALLYSDHAWYAALGATSIWSERVRDLFVLHAVSAAFAALFALVNLSLVRRSIVSLAFPRRLGNVQFGEEVPRTLLDRAAFIAAGLVAAGMTLVVPPWEALAMVRLGARFGETDPFFRADLSFFTAWLPLERAAYAWAVTLLGVVAALVVGLYALTPSLRWERGAFRVSAYVRRHLAILAALLLLVMAWGYRLQGYELLMHGSGRDGMFSYVDHQWLMPAYLSLSVMGLAAAGLVLVTGWAGQLRASFFTISGVLLLSVGLGLVLPALVRRLASADVATSQQRPYEATRAAYTARAYGIPRADPSAVPTELRRFASFADSSGTQRILDESRDSALVYPGASGVTLLENARRAAAPVLGRGLRRVAHAWSEQRLDLLWNDMPPQTRLGRRRDVRERVGLLFPLFAQGSEVIPAYLGDTLVWLVELHSASERYPLSRRFELAGRRRSYFRHAGTALVNSVSGRVTVVPAASPDPIAAAWRARFPANVRRGGADLLTALTATPALAVPMSSRPAGPVADDAFRREIARLYARMKAALAAGDLAAFAAAYDSLGAVVER